MTRNPHRHQVQRQESLASVLRKVNDNLVIKSPLLILLNLSQSLGSLLLRLSRLNISTSLRITNLLVLDLVLLGSLLQFFNPLLSAGKLILKVLDRALKFPLLSLKGDVCAGELLVLVGLDSDLGTQLGDGGLKSDDDLLEVADSSALLSDLSVLEGNLRLELGALLLRSLEICASLLEDLECLRILELVVGDDLVESGNLLLVAISVLESLVECLLEFLGLGNGSVTVNGKVVLGLVDVDDFNLESLDLLKSEMVIGIKAREALRAVSICMLIV